MFAGQSVTSRCRRAVAALAVLVSIAAGVVTGASPAQAAASKALAIGALKAGEGRVLAVNATTAGSRVVLSAYVTGSDALANRQRWTFEAAANSQPDYNEYTIKNAASGTCLANTGDAVAIKACSASTVWYIPLDSLYYQLRVRTSAGTYRCLDANRFGGTTAQLTTCDDESNAQAWRPRIGPTYCTFGVTSICWRYSPAAQGIMANWAHGPMTFTATAQSAAVSEYIEGQTVDGQGADAKFDRFDLGWNTKYTSTTKKVTYETFWREQSPALLAYHPVTQNAAADGQNHTYMSLPAANGQIDLLIDYNTVGTTTVAESSRVGYVESGIEGWYDGGAMRLGTAWQHRVQTLDLNGLWQRLPENASIDNARPCYGPTADGPAAPPNCLNTSTAFLVGADGRTQVDYFSLSQPAAAVAGPVVRSTPGSVGAQAVVNGVDQAQLAQCMTATPDACLSTVPGLAPCVQARLQCNAAAVASAALKPRGRAMTPNEAASATRTALTGSVGAASLTDSSLRTHRAVLANPRDSKTREVLTVSGGAAVRGLFGDRTARQYHGFHFTYDVASGRLLEACLGSCQ